MPGGWAAQRWGGRNTLMLSFALWSTASILTPINSVASAPIAAARMAVGVSQGLLIPSIHTVLAQVGTRRLCQSRLSEMRAATQHVTVTRVHQHTFSGR